MSNVYDHHRGRAVVSLASRRNRLAADFPGWGSPDYAKFLIPMIGGLAGVITDVESHGNAPHTRYCVRFDDGSRASGVVLGVDFTWADGSDVADTPAFRANITPTIKRMYATDERVMRAARGGTR